MERYEILEEIGDGTCGSVYKAVNIETSEIVAVKRMKRKYYYWEECVNLREVKSLRRLNHPNIIKLLEIVRQNNELFFIFEYMECSLYQIMKNQQRSFSEEEIRALMSQVLQGLVHVHKHEYFHRDLKPENLLVTNNTIKIADFGLARELSSSPPFTDYVSTRWYRAPEVLLQSASYTPAIDMWAVGAILAELYTSCPIFPGESEIDQLYKIVCVLGAPEWNTFPEATNISRLVDITYSDIQPADLSDIIPNASLAAIDLIKQLFSWDPLKRPTAEQCLQHPFFHVSARVPRPTGDALKLSLGSEPNLELNLWNFGTTTDDCFLGLTLAVKPSAPNLEMVHKNQGAKEDMMICPSFIDHSQQSVFWSLFPTEHHVITTSVEPSLSLSFSSVPNTSIGVPQSAGFGMSPFQSNILDRPLLATSSALPQENDEVVIETNLRVRNDQLAPEKLRQFAPEKLHVRNVEVDTELCESELCNAELLRRQNAELESALLRLQNDELEPELQFKGPITRLRAKNLQGYFQVLIRKKFEDLEDAKCSHILVNLLTNEDRV